MKISIIIPNYNRCDDVVRCIESINKQSCKDYEIVVVDDGSTDKSIEVIRSRYPNVILVSESKNSGPGHARNLGINMANGEYILFLDSDTEMGNKDVLDSFVDFYSNNPNAGCVGGEIRASDEDFSYVYGKSILFDGKSGDVSVLVEGQETHKKCDYLATCCCMIGRDILEKIGGFDPYYSYGGEDKDLGYRVQQAGYNNYVVKNCAVNHYHSPGGRYNDQTYRFHKTTLRFIMKNKSLSVILLTVLKSLLLFMKFYILLPFKIILIMIRGSVLKKENILGGFYILRSIIDCMRDYSFIRNCANRNFLTIDEINKFKYRIV